MNKAIEIIRASVPHRRGEHHRNCDTQLYEGRPCDCYAQQAEKVHAAIDAAEKAFERLERIAAILTQAEEALKDAIVYVGKQCICDSLPAGVGPCIRCTIDSALEEIQKARQ